MLNRNKTRAAVNADYYQRHGAAKQRASRDALARPKLRLHLLNAPPLGQWARAMIGHAELALGAVRVLWLLKLYRPTGKHADELALPLVRAAGGDELAPAQWLRGHLVGLGLTRGDYLILPNC